MSVGLSGGLSGRIGQQSFWAIAVELMLAGLVLNQIPVFGPSLVMALLWPGTCMIGRRLHDCGRSAVPVVLISALSALSGGTGILLGIAASVPDYVAIAFHFAALWSAAAGFNALGGLALFLWAGLLPGEASDNRFGPPEASPINLRDLIIGGR